MMSEKDKALEQVVLARLLRLNAMIHGIVFGLVLGLGVFLATLWLVLKGGEVVGPNLSLLGQFFIGYEVTFLGSLIGFGYGFLTGFLIGYLVASLYNWIVEFRESRVNHA
jgi:hypothetical protein